MTIDYCPECGHLLSNCGTECPLCMWHKEDEPYCNTSVPIGMIGGAAFGAALGGTVGALIGGTIGAAIGRAKKSK